ncbi:MAG: ComEC/Rec2 family competence protein [Patescibacteria group bacterium]
MPNKLNLHDGAFWLCLFFLIGIVLATLFTGGLYLITISVFLLSFYMLLIKKYNLAWLVLFVIVGAVYYQSFSYFQFKNINIPFGKEGEFSGLVEGVRGGATQELKLSLIGEYRGDISVRLSPYPEYKYGDVVKISGKINKPDEQYGNYYLSRSIFGAINFPKIELLEKNKGNFIKAKLFLFKEKIKDVFKTSLSKEKSAFLAGITIGAREDFSKEFKEKMSLSGTTHLVAMSGYNITVIAWAVGLVFASFFSNAASFYLSVLTITLFVLMAGAEASVVRAAIMGTIGLFAIQAERLFNPRNAIVIAAFIMVLFNPRVLVFDVGFQLSFAALLGMIYLSPVLKNALKIKSKGFFSWKENAVNTLSAQIMAMPILLSSFGFFSLSSLLANVLILEFIPITMGIGFVMAGLGLFSAFLANFFGVLANIFITYEFFIINIFSRFSIPLKMDGAGSYFWTIYYLAIFIFISVSLRAKRSDL